MEELEGVCPPGYTCILLCSLQPVSVILRISTVCYIAEIAAARDLVLIFIMMALSVAMSSTLPDLPPQPLHPPSRFAFPKREFGKKQIFRRSCHASLFSTWPWLHYQATDPKNVVFCHLCVAALKSKKMDFNRGDLAFKNWKDATVSFKKHEASASHKEALQVMLVTPSTCPDIGEMLSRGHAQEKSENRHCFLKILSSIHFLARQGIALRGDGDEADSNFVQLLKLRSADSWHKMKF